MTTAPPNTPATGFTSPDRAEFLPTSIRRPLVSVWGAALLTDRTETYIEARLDDTFQCAFDIAVKKGVRRAVRILTAEVLALKAGVKFAVKSFGDVLARIVPATRKTLRLAEVSFALHCSDWHVVNLVKSGCIEGRRGPANGWLIVAASLAAFLTARRLA